jgi:hypothetical protein
MKKSALALGIAAFAWIAAAQAQEVPKAKCEPKPDYPGRLGMSVDSKRKVFERDRKNYEDCIKAYIELRKAAIKANDAAANEAVEEYNTIMKKIQDDQKQ